MPPGQAILLLPERAASIYTQSSYYRRRARRNIDIGNRCMQLTEFLLASFAFYYLLSSITARMLAIS